MFVFKSMLLQFFNVQTDFFRQYTQIRTLQKDPTIIF